MSNPLKVEVTRDSLSGKTSIVGTPQQEEIRAMEHQVKDAVVHLLAEQFAEKYGHQILNELSPKIIADEVRKKIASKLL